MFARVSPEQKSRIIKVARRLGDDVAFLGDGVNDAVALHAADVGISVDSATDVAKDAADIVLLDKDLGVLADGVMEGRRIFANTMKYVLMATSSNFGNMFSAAGASLFLSFLPMLPSQILLNNLLYDVGQLAIPTDRVDPETVARPAAWDIGFVRRFMTVFGPISSIFDFLTFFVMLTILNAGHTEFRTGWFVESLATQTLVVFLIRTRRVPFFHSRPSTAMMITPTAMATARRASCRSRRSPTSLGFTALPLTFFLILVAMVVAYLALVEITKSRFYARERGRRSGPKTTTRSGSAAASADAPAASSVTRSHTSDNEWPARAASEAASQGCQPVAVEHCAVCPPGQGDATAGVLMKRPSRLMPAQIGDGGAKLVAHPRRDAGRGTALEHPELADPDRHSPFRGAAQRRAHDRGGRRPRAQVEMERVHPARQGHRSSERGSGDRPGAGLADEQQVRIGVSDPCPQRSVERG